MATIYDIAGTTSHTFTLGDGTTIFYGKANPTDDMGKIGDIYVQMNKEIYGTDTVKYLTHAEDPASTDPEEDLNNLEDYPSEYQTEHGTALPAGTYVKYIGSNSAQYYQWNGTSWNQAFDGNSKLGRVWYKEAFNNAKGSRWSFTKTYSFDEDVIHGFETGTLSNDFKIEIESADNANVVASTKANDYDSDKNRSAYGVTRFATDAESTSHVDKFISETPKQTYDNIIAITGLLSDLQTPVTTSLVASDNSLQAQIDTIVSKSDVVDLVGTYAELIAYDTQHLGTDDVIKVLQDETNSSATTYYRFIAVPTTPDVEVATKAALDAYSTTGLVEGNVAKVTADETHSNEEAYYVWRKLNGTYAWNYAGPCETSVHHDPDKHYWDRIGEEGPFYTKSESDGRFVHLTGSDTITGTKDFTGATVTVATQQASDSSTKAASTAYVTDAISTEDSKVVHNSGSDTITGTKDFTGATVTVATQQPNDNSTKAASTAYVDALIKVPAFTTSNNGQYLGVETNVQDPTKADLVWKSADNIAINDLTDVTITSPTSGQSLVYDATLNSNAGGWKNGSQVTATIKYW